jgi:hypothetical protein
MADHMHRYHDHTPPSPPQTPPPPVPTDAPDFAQLGTIFNDATRALEGGLWQTAVEEAGQGTGSVNRYISDLQNVHDGIQAQVNAGIFTGTTLSNAKTILSDLTTAMSAAQGSVNGGGTFGSVAAAENALHNSHLDILKTVAGDANLSQMATKDGATGFMAVPPTLDGVNPHNAPHANLAEIGAIFDDAANRSLGGINSQNKQAITNDVHAAITDMKQLIGDQPDAFSGLTGVHADAVVRQLQLELSFIKQANTNPVAGRASNDNLLDIIDIVQGDPNLAKMASQNGVSGFSPFPDALNDTPKYQDNEAQTNFWANFIANSNSLGDQAMQIVGNGDKGATHALINEIKTFETGVTQFDAAQGGIFEARFDNELLGKTSTLGAEVQAMVQGLKTGNADLVAAAATEMHANAADVGGNNIAFDGGTYNTDGRTAAEVRSLPPSGPLPAAVAVAPATTTGGSPAQNTAVAQEVHTNVADAGGHNIATTSSTHSTDGLTAPVTASSVAATPVSTPSAAATANVAAASTATNAGTDVAHTTQVPATPMPTPNASVTAELPTAPNSAHSSTDIAHATQAVDIATQHHFEHLWG